MFVYWKVEDAGSAQTIFNYARAAEEMGHEVVLYAAEDSNSRFTCSLDVEGADGVVFVLEWNIYLHDNKPLDLEGPVARSARERRVVIDDDGMYNRPVRVDGDYNHPAQEDFRKRRELYDWIADKIFQPTLHPEPDNAGSFLFHGYDPEWALPLDFGEKEFGMFYVGSNWFRWKALIRVLSAIEPIRDRVGRIGLVGHGWEEMPWWVEESLRTAAYFTDPDYLAHLGVEVGGAVPIEDVLPTMSKGVFNPVLVRPTFNHFQLVNPRLFETPAANTIPLFNLDEQYVREIYGNGAERLVLGDAASDQILDVLDRPEHYAEIVEDIRLHLAQNHSYRSRLQALIEIVLS